MKKVMTAMIAAAMIITNMICVFADNSCEFFADTNADGIDIILNDIDFDEKNCLHATFDIENRTEETDIDVLINVKDDTGKVLAASSVSRCIGKGETVPFRFGATDIIPSGDIRFEVRVTDKNPRMQTEVYVSQTGDDSGSGTAGEPVKSLAAAMEIVSSLNAQDEYSGEDVSVIIRDGSYAVDKTVNIRESDISNLGSLTVSGSGKDTILYSGIRVSGADFEKVTDAAALSMFPQAVSGKLYSLDLAKYGVSLSYRNGANRDNDPIFTVLYYNDRSEQMAKYPNTDYATGSVRIGKDSENRQTSIKSPEVKQWTNAEEAWLRGWLLYDWDLVWGRIASVANTNAANDIDNSISGKILTLQTAFCGSMPNDADRPVTAQNKSWYVYNLPSELDIEGEYAIKDNVLYYYPAEADVADGSFGRADISLNTNMGNMLDITSDNNVTVRNITFTNLRGDFINAVADNLKILGCTFKNGMEAVNVDGNNNLISACDFYNLGGSGAVVSGGDRNKLLYSESRIENCYFEKVSQINRTNCAPLVLSGCGVTARKNTITDTPHLAIGYTGNDHFIEYNNIYNCLTDNSSDAGIIYSGKDLSNIGTVIRNNYIHDSYSGLGAVYYDDWLSGQTTEGNVFENLERIMLVHGGIYNTFRNNIVVNADVGVNVVDKSRFLTVGGVKYNAWDEINGRYNAYMNVFMGKLEGIPESSGADPGVDWRSDEWQTAYGNVLAYVNNKTDDKASNTTISGNYFVNTDTAIYPQRGMKMADLILSDNTTNASELGAKQAQYNNIVRNCGIYADSYRIIN